MSGKRMAAFSRKSALGIMSRQYVVQFQLGTIRLLRFIDFLLAVERTQQIMALSLALKMADSPYISVLET